MLWAFIVSRCLWVHCMCLLVHRKLTRQTRWPSLPAMNAYRYTSLLLRRTMSCRPSILLGLALLSKCHPGVASCGSDTELYDYSSDTDEFDSGAWDNDATAAPADSSVDGWQSKPNYSANESTYHAASTQTVQQRTKSGPQDIQKPTVIVIYTNKMGAVDRADHYCASYGFMRKSQKWWRKMFLSPPLSSRVLVFGKFIVHRLRVLICEFWFWYFRSLLFRLR